jgi:hypothetical protein
MNRESKARFFSTAWRNEPISPVPGIPATMQTVGVLRPPSVGLLVCQGEG